MIYIIIIAVLILSLLIHKKETFNNKIIKKNHKNTTFSSSIKENNTYKKKLIILTNGGIGNRLSFISNIYEKANKLKRKVYIYWTVNRSLKCHYNKLFSEPKLNMINNIDSNINVYYIHKTNIKHFKMIKNNNKYPITKINDDKNDVVCVADFIENKSNDLLKIIKPSNIVKKQIDNFFSKNKKIIGIHIRCSDRFNCLKQPLLNNIKKTIHDIHNKYPEYLLFLATDDVEIRNILKKIYRKKIITSNIKLLKNKNFDISKSTNPLRNTEQGIIDSVVDLFCLSYCQKLIGFKISTFFYSAVEMSNLKKEDVYYIPLE